jgi:aryl-alcohol dehydrogenase-like predicted oxidoreductase
METRTLGRTGLDVSVVGFGAAPAAYLDTERQQAARLINDLLDAGVNLIDTAASYPGSEEFLGEFFARRRRDYVLVSKCGAGADEIDAPAWSQRSILHSVDRSLRRLRTDVVDVMLLHTCGLDTLKNGEALGALVKARDAGKIRHAGYSGDNEAAAWAAAQADVAVIETSVNVADQVNIDKVLPVAREHRAGVIAKRPVANAAWKDLGQQPGMYQSYAKEYTERLRKMNVRPSDLGFTAAPEQAWPEIALRFTLSFPDVHTAIIGTTNPQNARRNLDYAAKGPLPADAIDQLRAAFRKADPKGAWAGQG